MKDFEVGDEVLVKLVVRCQDDKDVMLGLPYHGFDDGLLDDQHWVSKGVVTENLGQPKPAEPQNLGAIVLLQTPQGSARYVRTENDPTAPWSVLGTKWRVSFGPYSWLYLTGPDVPSNTNRQITVEFAGLD